MQTAAANNTNVSSLGVAFGSNVTSGNTIIAVLSTYASNQLGTPTCSDTQGNTYTKVGQLDTTTADTGGDGFNGGVMFCAPVGSSAACTTTIAGLSSAHAIIRVFEFSGLASSAVDQFSAFRWDPASHSGLSATVYNSGTTGTTAQADELLIGVAMRPATSDIYNLPANWTDEVTSAGTFTSMMTGQRIVASAATYAFSGTLDSAYAWVGGMIGTFKADTGGGSPSAFPHYYYQALRR